MSDEMPCVNVLGLDAASTAEDRAIDLTATGRRSGRPRRIEIVFYR
jgi:hypothetical protein